MNAPAQQSTPQRDHRFVIIVLLLIAIGGYLIHAHQNARIEREEMKQTISKYQNQIDQYQQVIAAKTDSISKIVAKFDETVQTVAGNYDPQITRDLRTRYNKPVVLSKVDTLVNKGEYHKLVDQAQVAGEALVQLDSCERNRMQIMEIQHNTVLTLQKGITDLGYSIADKPVLAPVIITDTKKPRFGFVEGVVAGFVVEAGFLLLFRK